MAVDTRLSEAATRLLDKLADELEARGIDVPTRRYVHAGLIAQDWAGENCSEAFVVSWLNSLQGELGSTQQSTLTPIRCAMPVRHTFAIALFRCVPVLNDDGIAPSTDRLNAKGLDIMDDAMTLAAAIVDLAASKTLFENEFTQTAITAVQAVGPTGGVGGTVLQLSVSLTI